MTAAASPKATATFVTASVDDESETTAITDDPPEKS